MLRAGTTWLHHRRDYRIADQAMIKFIGASFGSATHFFFPVTHWAWFDDSNAILVHDVDGRRHINIKQPVTVVQLSRFKVVSSYVHYKSRSMKFQSHTHWRRWSQKRGGYNVLPGKVCSWPKSRFFKIFSNLTFLSNEKTCPMQLSSSKQKSVKMTKKKLIRFWHKKNIFNFWNDFLPETKKYSWGAAASLPPTFVDTHSSCP